MFESGFMGLARWRAPVVIFMQQLPPAGGGAKTAGNQLDLPNELVHCFQLGPGIILIWARTESVFAVLALVNAAEKWYFDSLLVEESANGISPLLAKELRRKSAV